MTISIPISDLKNPPNLQFPNRCVNCGKPKEEMLGLSFDMGVQKKKQQVFMKIPVSMCKKCAEKERNITKVTLIPFLIAGVIFGAIAFFPVLLIAPEGTTPQTLNLPFVLAGSVALFAGIILGTIVEAIVKILSIPVYGKLVTKRSLTIMSFFSNTDHLIGISGKFLPKEKQVLLEFENEDIASEFIKINHLENK